MYGGEITYEILENPKNGRILAVLPLLEGDESSVAIRLGPNVIRLGFKCGRYYDLKGVSDEMMAKVKEKGRLFCGERDESDQTQRAYEAVVVA